MQSNLNKHILNFSFVKEITQLRSEAKSKNKKNQYKLIVNSLFGKFLQNNEKFVETKIHRSIGSLSQCINSPYYISYSQITTDFVLTFERPKKLEVNKPILIGVII